MKREGGPNKRVNSRRFGRKSKEWTKSLKRKREIWSSKADTDQISKKIKKDLDIQGRVETKKKLRETVPASLPFI